MSSLVVSISYCTQKKEEILLSMSFGISLVWHVCLMGRSRGEDRVSGPPLKITNRKAVRFLSNTLENHKATKPVFNVWPSLAHQRNTISMAFRWRADDGPLKVVFGSSLPSSTKIKPVQPVRVDPLLPNFLEPRMCLTVVTPGFLLELFQCMLKL